MYVGTLVYILNPFCNRIQHDARALHLGYSESDHFVSSLARSWKLVQVFQPIVIFFIDGSCR